MLFNSYSFIIYFIVVSALYYLLPHRYRWMMLLVASSYFYMAFVPKYILILFATIVVNYVAGILLDSSYSERARKGIFLACIISNIAVLGFFKYFNFFAENINAIAQALNFNYSLSLLSIILPIGLSFHTFQALSYVFEVYRKKQKAEKHLGIYALYVMYYPQLVAGPIERPQNLLHQFHAPHAFDPEGVTLGLKRMAWGFFKKTVVADNLAIIVNAVYANPQAFDGPTLIMAMVFFAIQLYCDFSGYSDIALGASKVMGISLMENFERPYFSKSIAEFWRRWHISLSTWLRDYLYYPLALSIKKPSRIKLYGVTLVTFLVSGLWHGASWTYVCMGGIFGMYIIFAEIRKRIKFPLPKIYVYGGLNKRLSTFCNVLLTFSLVCIGWVFFRATSIDQAIYIITHTGNGLFDFLSNSYKYQTWKNLLSLNGLILKSEVIIAIVSSLIVFIYDLIERRISFWLFLARYHFAIRWFVYYGLILSILSFGIFGAQEFIYFQF